MLADECPSTSATTFVSTPASSATVVVVLPGADHQGTVDALTTEEYAGKIMSHFVAQSQT
jgi:hypothetical protein